MSTFRVHPSAHIEPGAELGDAVTIWQQCHVREGAVVGAGTSLGRNVFVDAGVRIGSRCKVQNNVSIYRGVELGNAVFVGPLVVFTNDLRPRADSATWHVTPTYVADHASIGAGAVLVCGVHIGHHAMVGAGAVVTRDVQPYQLVMGNPATARGWVCDCGRSVESAGASCGHDGALSR